MSKRSWMPWIAAIGPIVAACATDATVARDAHINSAFPNTNFGGLSNVFVGNGGTALIQFDLSSPPAGITSSQIAKATPKLYVNRINTAGLVDLLPVTTAWSESTVTFATVPSLGSSVAAFTPARAEQFVVIDITSLVQSWVAFSCE